MRFSSVLGFRRERKGQKSSSTPQPRSFIFRLFYPSIFVSFFLFLPSFFVVDILPLPPFIHFLDHCVCVCVCVFMVFWFSCCLSQPVLPNQSLIGSSTHFLILFHCTSTFPLSHSVAQCFSSSVSGTFLLLRI
jgi:hypothetical protein